MYNYHLFVNQLGGELASPRGVSRTQIPWPCLSQPQPAEPQAQSFDLAILFAVCVSVRRRQTATRYRYGGPYAHSTNTTGIIAQSSPLLEMYKI